MKEKSVLYLKIVIVYILFDVKVINIFIWKLRKLLKLHEIFICSKREYSRFTSLKLSYIRIYTCTILDVHKNTQRLRF